MALDATKIQLAAVDNWSVGGTDLGGTSAPTILATTTEFLEIKAEQFFGIVKYPKIDMSVELRTQLLQATLENYAFAANLPQSNITSTAATKSLAVNSNSAGELALVVTGKAGSAPGTNKIRVIDAPKTVFVTAAEMPIAQKEVSVFDVVAKVIVDSAGLFCTVRDQL